MKNGKCIMLQAPAAFNTGDEKAWEACYSVVEETNAMLVRIQSRSSIEVVIAKITTFGNTNYYISSPNFQVAIPSIPTLLETFWITEKLIACDMPAPDAITIAKVLTDIGDF